MAWNSLQREKGGRGETKRRGGANEALLNKPPKTTHVIKVGRQFIQTSEVLTKSKEHGSQCLPRHWAEWVE